MAYKRTRKYNRLVTQLIDNEKGLYSEYGRLGEECVVKLLNNLGYNVKLADDENQEGYDAIIYDKIGSPFGAIQIKTDVDGDGKCPKMKNKQIEYIKNLFNKYGTHITPFLIEYYPYFNDTMLLYNFDERVWLYSVGSMDFITFE